MCWARWSTSCPPEKLAEATLRQAIQAAAQARDDDRSAQAWGALSVVLAAQGRYEEALAQRTAMEASVARAGDGDLLPARRICGASSGPCCGASDATTRRESSSSAR